MNNKNRLLFMAEILYQYTDEENSITTKKIRSMLISNGFNGNKNTLSDDIEALRYFGFDIVHDNRNGYKLINRLFDTTELQILADAIASFRFLTEERSNQLIEKLKVLCSKYEAKKIHRHFHIRNRVKTDNRQVLINIDAISTAMKENKQFSFDYYDYNIKNEMVYNGTRICSPWEIAISSEEYYAVTYYLKYPTHPTNFRIDRMKNIHIIESRRVKPPEDIDIGKYLKSSFSMFSGKERYVTLQFPMENRMCNIVYDKFGHDTHIYEDGHNHFKINVPIKADEPKALFSWLALFEGRVQILEPVSLEWEFLNRMENIVKSTQNAINEYTKNHRTFSDNIS